MPSIPFLRTPRGWAYMSGDHEVADYPECTEHNAWALDGGQSDVAAAANYAAEAKAAAYGPVARAKWGETVIGPNASQILNMLSDSANFGQVDIAGKSITIPRAGYYAVWAVVSVAAGDGMRGLDVLINGSTPLLSDFRPGVTSSSVTYTASFGPYPLNAGDRLSGRMWTQSGGTVTSGWLTYAWQAGIQ